MTDFASDFAAAFLSNPDEIITVADQDDEVRSDAGGDATKKSRSLRRGLIKAANLQDMLLEKYV